MSEFDETLGAVLNDPDAMNQIMALAQSLSGRAQKKDEADGEAPEPEVIRKGENLVRQISGSSDPGTELLHALSPYLKEERRERLDRALELARTTKLIRTAVAAMAGREEAGDV